MARRRSVHSLESWVSLNRWTSAREAQIWPIVSTCPRSWQLTGLHQGTLERSRSISMTWVKMIQSRSDCPKLSRSVVFPNKKSTSLTMLRPKEQFKRCQLEIWRRMIPSPSTTGAVSIMSKYGSQELKWKYPTLKKLRRKNSFKSMSKLYRATITCDKVQKSRGFTEIQQRLTKEAPGRARRWHQWPGRSSRHPTT